MAQHEPAEQKLRQVYDKSEKQMSRASEQLVASQGFAEALAMLTSNAVALSKVFSTGLDTAVRATRFAGQRDITRLGRQLNRTEDKLEQVLQAVEHLEEELAVTRAERDEARATAGVPANTMPSATARTSRAPRQARSASVTPAGGAEQ